MRALLASGLVLGVGGAVTLAAWNDSEHSQASFSAGTFGIEGAVNGTAFSEHPSQATTATMTFPATPMVPGTTSYAMLSVRTINPSVAGASLLTANAANSGGLGQYLTYGVRTIAGTTCNATTFAAGTVLVTAGSPLTTGATATQALQANRGNQVNYCFAVTLPATAPNAAQGLALTARWEAVGTAAAP
ncbi:SipW-dependent-type signal peptide-containing protein [Agrococcus baldri]|uniref:SipW-dependent-type signal peptide-containing protein n=1 Tax=Agrococcus baldri TaxID=153730 RepID=UPI00296FD88A|nr:SipW-dependent-type signal peptide-containing protein [Agrococcus baldri]